MALKLVSRINTVLFVVPVIIILAIYLGIGVWVCFWGAADLIGDFHSAQLVTMLSDKKNGVELWFDIRRKAIEEIAGSPVISDDIRVLAETIPEKGSGEDSEEAGGKNPDNSATRSMSRISKFLSGFGHFKSISFVAGDGRLLWTAGRELTGSDNHPGEVVLNIPYGKTAVFPGKISSKDGSGEILISAPALLKDTDIQVSVVGQLNPADLASSLIVEKGFYETGRVAVIDDEGITLASTDMTDAGKIRYDVPRGSGDGVGYRDGIFYVVAPLKFDGIRLIAMLDGAEASKPLGLLLNLYLLFAGVILLIVVMQVLLLAPRLINRPFKRLINATQSVSTGDFRAINLKKGFFGELKILSENFSSMIVGLSRVQSGADKDASSSSMDRTKTMMTHVFAVEARGRLDIIKKAIEAHTKDCKGEDKDIAEAVVDLKRLSETIEAFNLLVRHRDGSFRPIRKKIDLWAMLKETEDEYRAFVGGKEVELALEGHKSLLDTDIICDQKSLHALIAALLRHAVRVTDVGIITLLASIETKDGVEYLEFVLSDTGVGVDPRIIEWTTRGGAFPYHRVDLGIAREIAELLGGRLTIENLHERGSLVTVLIPNKIQETEEGQGAEETQKTEDKEKE
jgi:signal transduction histidine kinase